MSNEKLEDYIRQNLEKGYKKLDIINFLAEKGYSKEKIAEAVKNIEKNDAPAKENKKDSLLAGMSGDEESISISDILAKEDNKKENAELSIENTADIDEEDINKDVKKLDIIHNKMGMILIALVFLLIVIFIAVFGFGLFSKGGARTQCGMENRGLCRDSSSCSDAGGEWIDEICNSGAKEEPGQEEEPDNSSVTTYDDQFFCGNVHNKDMYDPTEYNRSEEESLRCFGNALATCTSKTITIIDDEPYNISIEGLDVLGDERNSYCKVMNQYTEEMLYILESSLIDVDQPPMEVEKTNEVLLRTFGEVPSYMEIYLEEFEIYFDENTGIPGGYSGNMCMINNEIICEEFSAVSGTASLLEESKVIIKIRNDLGLPIENAILTLQECNEGDGSEADVPVIDMDKSHVFEINCPDLERLSKLDSDLRIKYDAIKNGKPYSQTKTGYISVKVESGQ